MVVGIEKGLNPMERSSKQEFASYGVAFLGNLQNHLAMHSIGAGTIWPLDGENRFESLLHRFFYVGQTAFIACTTSRIGQPKVPSKSRRSTGLP